LRNLDRDAVGNGLNIWNI